MLGTLHMISEIKVLEDKVGKNWICGRICLGRIVLGSLNDEHCVVNVIWLAFKCYRHVMWGLWFVKMVEEFFLWHMHSGRNFMALVMEFLVDLSCINIGLVVLNMYGWCMGG